MDSIILDVLAQTQSAPRLYQCCRSAGDTPLPISAARPASGIRTATPPPPSAPLGATHAGPRCAALRRTYPAAPPLDRTSWADARPRFRTRTAGRGRHGASAAHHAAPATARSVAVAPQYERYSALKCYRCHRHCYHLTQISTPRPQSGNNCRLRHIAQAGTLR